MKIKVANDDVTSVSDERLHVRAFARACVFTCVRFHVRAFARACVCTCVRLHVRAFARACGMTESE